MDGDLPEASDVLAVVAHPDDESFGLGAILAGFAGHGARVRVLCFTHGEASTLGRAGQSLAEVRGAELRAAAEALGVGEVDLLTYPDGRLGHFRLGELAGVVAGFMGVARLLVVFDRGGVTGHADHRRATDAAVIAGRARRVPVLGWALPQAVATQLNTELDTSFLGRRPAQLDVSIVVDRARQREAIACHASQSSENPVLWRRLELLGPREWLRWLVRDPSPRETGV